jgi:hypothetical protein
MACEYAGRSKTSNMAGTILLCSGSWSCARSNRKYSKNDIWNMAYVMQPTCDMALQISSPGWYNIFPTKLIPSAWDASGPTTSKEISRLLWNQNFHCYVYKRPLLDPTLIHTNPNHTLPLCLIKDHLNILPSMPRSSEWALPFRVPNQKFFNHLSFPPCELHAPFISSSASW